MSSVREPAVAGLFYPDLKAVLEREVGELLLRAKSSRVEGPIRGLICPHAGYVYSGYTAAVGYRLLKGHPYDAVVVVGPSHREYFDGISVYPGDSYRTPLGDIPIDTDLRKRLTELNPIITLSDAGHQLEHSIEVQLPFLQQVLGKCPLAPVVMGDQRREYCAILAQAIAEACKGRNVLLIASSDLSHYHPYAEAVRLDREVIDEITEFRPDRLLEKLDQEQAEACGGGPIAAVMMAAASLGARKCKELFYCNSGDVTGDKETVVGYLSAALIQEP
ncbi:MAG TPA: AmmeMemoRadiSam system protein B [Bacteroidota bacterium]